MTICLSAFCGATQSVSELGIEICLGICCETSLLLAFASLRAVILLQPRSRPPHAFRVGAWVFCCSRYCTMSRAICGLVLFDSIEELIEQFQLFRVAGEVLVRDAWRYQLATHPCETQAA